MTDPHRTAQSTCTVGSRTNPHKAIPTIKVVKTPVTSESCRLPAGVWRSGGHRLRPGSPRTGRDPPGRPRGQSRGAGCLCCPSLQPPCSGTLLGLAVALLALARGTSQAAYRVESLGLASPGVFSPLHAGRASLSQWHRRRALSAGATPVRAIPGGGTDRRTGGHIPRMSVIVPPFQA